MKNKYTGSYFVIGLGVLYWIGSAFSIVKESSIGPICGSSMILGGFAYMSLKKRRLGVVKNSKLRQGLEIFAALLIIGGTFFDTYSSSLIETNFLANFIIPMISIAMYSSLRFKKLDNKITANEEPIES